MTPPNQCKTTFVLRGPDVAEKLRLHAAKSRWCLLRFLRLALVTKLKDHAAKAGGVMRDLISAAGPDVAIVKDYSATWKSADKPHPLALARYSRKPERLRRMLTSDNDIADNKKRVRPFAHWALLQLARRSQRGE